MYIVPPKLNKDVLLAGLKIWEAALYLSAILGSIALKSILLVGIVIASTILTVRWDGDINAYGFMATVFRYLTSAQTFLRKGELNEEDKNQFTL